jgi:hypothetical protein
MQWWQDLLGRYSFENKFPPSRLRHIFVDERLGLDSVDGPDNKAAARIMGNSVGEGLVTTWWSARLCCISAPSTASTLHHTHGMPLLVAFAERWEISYNKQNMLRDVNQAARETTSVWRQQLLALLD